MSDNQDSANEVKDPENPIADFYSDERARQMQELEPGIRKARNALFVTAGLILIFELISVSRSGIGFPPLLIGILVFEVGSFVALGFWTKTKPYTAIIVGLILFILLWIAGIILTDESAIYKGIIVKAIIIGILISALKPAKAWEDLKKNS